MKNRMIVGLAVVLAVLVSQAAFADYIALRTGGGTTNGVTYQDAVTDDTYTDYNGSTNHGTEVFMWIQHYTNATLPAHAGLVGWADLFSLVPTTHNGNAIVIDCATLHLTYYIPGSIRTSGALSDTVTVYRMTTNWLTGPAGTNEANVNGLTNHGAAWAGGGAITTADWTTGNAVSFPAYDSFISVSVNITALMMDLYDNGGVGTPVNAGFALDVPLHTGGWSTGIATSENDLAYRPALEMTYHYAGTATPEPATLLLMGTGALGVMGYIRRRKMS